MIFTFFFKIFAVLCCDFVVVIYFHLFTVGYPCGPLTGWFQICLFVALFFSEDVGDAWACNFITFSYIFFG